MNQKGFSLVTVLVLSLVIFLIGSTGLYIATTGVKMTKADMNLNLAEKAANAGLMDAQDRINQAGTGGTTSEITGNIGIPEYKTLIEFGGRNLWFLSSEGKDRHSNNSSTVVKTGLFQGFLGAGVYTVRGNVNATLNNTRITGCDPGPTASVDDDCFVPAFIASGTINATGTGDCTNANATSGTTAGIYGNSPTLNLNQGDLSRIFFRVQCFNSFGVSCNPSLLDYFEYDYGWSHNGTPDNPPDPNDRRDMDFQQSVNRLSIPIVSIPDHPNPFLPAVPSVSAGCTQTTGTLNLATDKATCSDIVMSSTLGNVTIQGVRGGAPVNIYTSSNTNVVTFDGASNFVFYTTSNYQNVMVKNSSDFIINSTNGNTLSGNSNFTLLTTGATTLNNTNSNFILNARGTITVNNGSNLPDGRMYTTNTVTLNGTIAGTQNNPFRLVTQNQITALAGVSLSYGTIISGPAQVNDTNNIDAPQNFVAQGAITMQFINMFVRSFRVTSTAGVTARIMDSLMYVYAFACPNCSRTTNSSSFNACAGDSRWCGVLTGNNDIHYGRAADGTARPSIFISNNSTFYMLQPPNGNFIWGVWYGEDVNYLGLPSNRITDIRGFLIRNFPVGLSLTIAPNNWHRFTFSRSIIDQVVNRYRFMRRVTCVREPLTPRAQLIQTRMTNY